MRSFIISLFVAAFFLGTTGPVKAQCTQIEQLTVDCTLDGTVLTVTADAATRRCGMPEQIPTVDNLTIQVQQLTGNWLEISKVEFTQVDLPRTESFDLCALAISPDATAVRGRVFQIQNPQGLLEAICHRINLPAC